MEKKLQYDLLETGYFLLPYLLFFMVWFKPFVSIPMSILIIVYIKKMATENKEQLKLQWTALDIIVMLLLLAWIYLSGIGGFEFQNGDWKKHNAIISDLVNRKWPVTYQNENTTYLMIYYLGYYLPATFVGKLFQHSIEVSNNFLFLWTSFSIFLLYIEIKIAFSSKAWFAAIVFVFFSGMDSIGYFLIHSNLNKTLQVCTHLEAWTYMKYRLMLQYSSHTTQLFWVPQHALAGWISTMFIYRNQRKINQVILRWCLTIFYSPFVFVGLFPFVIYLIIKNLRDNNTMRCFEIETIIGLISALLCGLYYISNTNNVESMTLSFLWENLKMREAVCTYLLFVSIEFLFLALLVKWSLRKKPWRTCEREWLTIIIVILFVLPLVKYGLYNDLCMRASIPALTLFWMIIMGELLDNLSYNKIKYIIGVLLLIGAVTPATEINRSLKYSNNQNKVMISSILEMPKIYQQQYIDYHATDNWFYMKLMKKRH